MSPRTGRPKATNPKSINLTIRLDADTAKKLAEFCKKAGMSKAEAIRRGIELLLSK